MLFHCLSDLFVLSLTLTQYGNSTVSIFEKTNFCKEIRDLIQEVSEEDLSSLSKRKWFNVKRLQ